MHLNILKNKIPLTIGKKNLKLNLTILSILAYDLIISTSLFLK